MAAYNFTSNGWCLKPDANWIRVVPWSSFASLVNIYSIFIQTYSVLHKKNCLQNFGKQENIRGEVLQRNEGLNRYFLNFFRTDIQIISMNGCFCILWGIRKTTLHLGNFFSAFLFIHSFIFDPDLVGYFVKVISNDWW